MAYSWQSISSSDLAQYESLNSSRSDIAKLKNNIGYLIEKFDRSGDTNFNVTNDGTGQPEGKALSKTVIEWVQDLNALGEIQTCASYNSTQYTTVCSTNYANYSNKGAQCSPQNSNYSEDGDMGDRGNYHYNGDDSPD